MVRLRVFLLLLFCVVLLLTSHLRATTVEFTGNDQNKSTKKKKTETMMMNPASPFATLLKQHIKANPYAGYVTMATVENSRPRARTVLFQGLATGENGQLG
jgi:hypothetical protein